MWYTGRSFWIPLHPFRSAFYLTPAFRRFFISIGLYFVPFNTHPSSVLIASWQHFKYSPEPKGKIYKRKNWKYRKMIVIFPPCRHTWILRKKVRKDSRFWIHDSFLLSFCVKISFPASFNERFSGRVESRFQLDLSSINHVWKVNWWVASLRVYF